MAGDADADGDARAAVSSGSRDRRRMRAPTSCRLRAVGARQDDGELVAAVAVGPVAVADRLAHGPGDLGEEAVAGRMAVRVVEDLEPVEVHHQDGERTTGDRRAPHRARAGRRRGCAGR